MTGSWRFSPRRRVGSVRRLPYPRNETAESTVMADVKPADDPPLSFPLIDQSYRFVIVARSSSCRPHASQIVTVFSLFSSIFCRNWCGGCLCRGNGTVVSLIRLLIVLVYLNSNSEEWRMKGISFMIVFSSAPDVNLTHLKPSNF